MLMFRLVVISDSSGNGSMDAGEWQQGNSSNLLSFSTEQSMARLTFMEANSGFTFCCAYCGGVYRQMLCHIIFFLSGY